MSRSALQVRASLDTICRHVIVYSFLFYVLDCSPRLVRRGQTSFRSERDGEDHLLVLGPFLCEATSVRTHESQLLRFARIEHKIAKMRGRDGPRRTSAQQTRTRALRRMAQRRPVSKRCQTNESVEITLARPAESLRS